jgi:hypothetical protein
MNAQLYEAIRANALQTPWDNIATESLWLPGV